MSETPKVLKPGLYPGMPEEEYHDYTGNLTQSGIKKLLECPLSYYREYLAEIKQRGLPSLPMIEGSVLHMLLLEPERTDDIVVVPPFKRNTKAGKADWEKWCDDNDLNLIKRFRASDFPTTFGGKYLVPSDFMARMTFIAGYVSQDSAFKAMRRDATECELSFAWENWDSDFGVPCRGRADFMTNDGLICDIKTTSSPLSWDRMAHMQHAPQAAWYKQGLEANDVDVSGFCFIVVERRAPYPFVEVRSADEEFLAYGAHLCTEARLMYERCKAADRWPNRSGQLDDQGNVITQIKPLTVPKWAKDAYGERWNLGEEYF